MKRVTAFAASLALLAACGTEQPSVMPDAAPSDRADEAPDPAACIPDGQSRESLAALKATGFAFDEQEDAEAFALAITACLASPDPALRDGVAYEALTALMRERRISVEAMQALRADLEIRMDSTSPDGFEAPFAVLALSEVVRADRIQPFLSQQELDRITQKANRYMTGLADYRGFHPDEGWRHGVAHGADLMMQLALNPRVPRRGLELIRGGVAAQAGPTAHAYIHGEPERLARPILMIARRGVFTEREWTDWFTRTAGPGPLRTWENAYASEASLNRRHNLMAFLSALYLNAALSEDANDNAILPGAEAMLRTLP